MRAIEIFAFVKLKIFFRKYANNLKKILTKAYVNVINIYGIAYSKKINQKKKRRNKKMGKKSFLKSSLIIIAVAAVVLATIPFAKVNAAEKLNLTYSAHVQDYGWKDSSIFASNGLEKLENEVSGIPSSFAGTMGEYKRMEAVRIRAQLPEGSTVKVRAHVEGYGWQDPVTLDNTGAKDTEIGTTGEYKRMEALQITAEGLNGSKILYRAHVEGYGWQDWVDASDPDAFAGTTGEYKRMEALEIAIVSADGFKYQSNEDGTHTFLYNDVELSTEDCTYSGWIPASEEDDELLERTCTLCNHKEEKTLNELLSDESITELEVKNVKKELTVPAGKTLTVDENISGENPVTVNGTLVLKKVQSNLKLKGNGTVVYAPEAESSEDFATKFPKATEILDGLKSSDDNTAKSLKYEIKVPEMDEPQTITETSPITLEEGWNLTVDLGNNILKTTDKSNSFITNKGDLTLKNGVVEIPNDSQKFVINSGANTTATLNLENVDIIGHSGISTNGNLVMNGGKIESNGTASQSRALQILGERNIKANTTELTDVDVKSKHIGIFISTDIFHDLVMNGGSITVENNSVDGYDGALTSYSQYSSITLDGTKITSDGMGIYLQNNGGSTPNALGGNVAHLNDVTIESKKVCIWTCADGDKVEVDGGSYKSTTENAVRIYSRELNTFKDCRLEGKGTAITVLGSLLQNHELSEFADRTNVTEVNV